MSCDVDMAAVALAVTAIASDGKPRGVNLSPQSLAHPQFLPRLRERIVAAGASARNLWVEVDESALERHPEALVELCRQLRPHGVHLGLEHAGDRLSSIGLLLEPGLDYVKISSSWARIIASSKIRQSHEKPRPPPFVRVLYRNRRPSFRYTPSSPCECFTTRTRDQSSGHPRSRSSIR